VRSRKRSWVARVAVAMYLATALLFVQAEGSGAATFTVTTTNDGGPGSLRQAIIDANATPAADEIRFALPATGGALIIQLAFSALPDITAPVIIDGTTQPGFVDRPVVEVRGPLIGAAPLPGFVLATGSTGSVIRGLSITGFTFTTAVLLSGDGNVIERSWVGVGVDGAARGNTTGVLVNGNQNTVGRGNVISNNASAGISIAGSDNIVIGNIVGLDPGGGLAAPNGAGVIVGGSAARNRIGGTVALDRNVISGNGLEGIRAGGAVATVILGNFIGTDATGGKPVGNATGIRLGNSPATIGGTTPGAGNVVSGNTGAGTGISVSQSSGTVVQGNFIGTNATGTAALGNGGAGLSIEGGRSYLVADNVIAGNGTFTETELGTLFFPDEGIAALFLSDLTIQGNRIGVGATGGALANRDGIALYDTAGVLVGGTGAGQGNVISGNEAAGISLYCLEFDGPVDTTIQGNVIGTDASGTIAVGNSSGGIRVECGAETLVGGTVAGAGNIISANGSHGIFDAGTDEVIQGNRIGVDVNGNALGNDGSGVFIDSSFPEVGGDVPEAGNIIAFNEEDGVTVFSGVGNPIRLNSIHDNGGLGIDLNDDGLSPNDPGDTDELANLTQNFPVLTSVIGAGAVATIAGTLDTGPGRYVLDFYGNPAAAGAEGQTYLGSFTVDVSSGPVAFSAPNIPVAGGTFVTATATDVLLLNTSEFSPAVAAQFPVTITTQASPSVPVGGQIFDTATLAGDIQTGATLTFRVYGPDDANCAGTPVVSSVPVTAGQFTYQSPTFITNAAGTYRWVAEYSVAGVVLASTACNDPNESVLVTRATPTISTQASPAVTLGGAIFDTATLAGGFNPTGTVTFNLYGPNNATCAGGVAFTSSPTLAANGTAASGPFVPLLPGTYRWVASYSGDANNAPVAGACNDPNESVVVSPAPTTTSSSTSTSTSTSSTSTTTTSTTVPRTTTTSTSTTTTSTSTTSTSTTTSTTLPTTTTSSTTTLPPTTTSSTTTTSTTTTVPPVPAGSTTTVVTTTTIETPATTSTVAPDTTALPPTTAAPTTTTTAPRPTGPASTIDAVNFDGERSGPPGVGLNVAGGGYLDCDTVYFFFDGVRIGSDTPDATGAVGAGRLSVPGNTKPGEHRVTSSCRPSGDVVRASSTFLVTDADVHRTAVVTSLAHPDQISLELERVMASAAVAGLIILLFAFPSKLFNAAVEENYDEIRGWFHLPGRVVDSASSVGRAVTFVVMNLLAAIVLGFLNPDFGPDMTGLVTVLGFFASFVVMSAGFSLPADIGLYRRTGEWGKLNFLPGTLLASVVMVALSRVMDFQPGYFYGAIAGLAFAVTLNAKEQGRLTAANWTWALFLSLAAWFARIPVSEAAAQPDANVWWIGLEAGLVITFLWGVESLVVAMLPMRFLDGPKVRAWSRTAWLALLFVGILCVVHVLLAPTAGYVGHTTGEVTVGVLVIFVIFGAVSVATWAYFRYRPERWVPKSAR
jgi:hypothetical protein